MADELMVPECLAHSRDGTRERRSLTTPGEMAHSFDRNLLRPLGTQMTSRFSIAGSRIGTRCCV
jgi:hypothetical protein